MRWFDRRFELGLPLAAFPPVLDRLCSMPDRLEAAVAGLRPDAARARTTDAWSIQENIGHLLDLEELWERRLDDFDAGATVLHPADLENRKTHEADHNSRELADLLRDFRVARTRIASRLEAMSSSDLMRVGLHPRLQQPMSVVDLAFFVAEHDDHHLGTINALRLR
jgi:uncharacterized damage-inducible protein DinB